MTELLNWLTGDSTCKGVLPENLHVITHWVSPDKVELQFNGWAIVLLANGTWYPLDTSGG